MRWNRSADDQALDLPQKGLFGHEVLQPPTGLADGLEVGVLYHPPPLVSLRYASVGETGCAPVSGMLTWVPRTTLCARPVCSDGRARSELGVPCIMGAGSTSERDPPQYL